MSELPEDFLDQIKAIYPSRSGGQGWPNTRKAIMRHVKNGTSFEDIIAGTKKYAAWCDATGKTGTELVKMAQTFFGPGEWWGEDYDLPVSSCRYDGLRKWAES